MSGRRIIVTLLLALAAGAVAPALAAPECLECHEEGALAAGRVHEGLECSDCHAGIDLETHPDAAPPAPACETCHEDAVAEFAASVHAEPAVREATAAGDCQACHGPIHDLVSGLDADSPVHGSRQAATCGRCHADPQLAARLGIVLVQPIEAYSASVHARALSAGEKAAGCSDCHGAHRILRSSDPASRVHRTAIPATCAACHSDVALAFAASVHGRAAAHGIREAPVCTDCHGEHAILGPGDRSSPVFATNIPKLTCGRCHGDLRLSAKFGMSPDKVPAYTDSFHGLASRAGATTVANCASCHGVHDILPSSDPGSHTHAANLAATCGQCHPGAGKRFALGPVHVLATRPEHAAVYWIRRVYLAVIVVTIGLMLAHNLADLARKAGRPRPSPPAGAAERMSAGFRLAHALLAASFVVLAYSGFALAYPEAWWALPLLQWEEGFGLRGLVHRAAALVMVAAGLWHVVHLAVDSRARACIAEMWPRRADWGHLKDRLAYLCGRRAEAPREPWVSYVEKVEYLAVIWGSAVMGLTGFFLWFEEITLAWLPSWVADVATVVHFYEAVLATLAILVWHFYSVIFDPWVYPMDGAWLSGRSAAGRAGGREAGPRR